MSAVQNDVPKVSHLHYWENTVKEHPELENVINAVTSGNLLASANGGRLSLVLDQFSGLAMVGPWVVGAANMRGSPLPPLPSSGTFDITFTLTTAVLNIKDHSGLIIHQWNGTGIQSGLTGFFNGHWVRLIYKADA